jgi:protein-L-isoaspartate(D-aspartate) O-methyltransferase
MSQDQALGRMLQQQLQAKGITNKAVLAAIAATPRELFLPSALRNKAYNDEPLPIGYGQTSSEPYIIALMLELADIKPVHKVLEIGVGSGYLTAIIAQLANKVIGLEVIGELLNTASSALAQYPNIQLQNSDGYLGWPPGAPFDRIIVSASSHKVPEPLLDQLAINGKLIIPIGRRMQEQQLQIITKQADDTVITTATMPARLLPLINPNKKPL